MAPGLFLWSFIGERLTAPAERRSPELAVRSPGLFAIAPCLVAISVELVVRVFGPFSLAPCLVAISAELAVISADPYARSSGFFARSPVDVVLASHRSYIAQYCGPI